MKTKHVISLLIGITFVALGPATWAAEHGGASGGFGGGHFGGGGGVLFGGASMGASHSGGFGRVGGVRYSFGARPTYGRPVYVRPQSGITSSTVHSPTVGRQQSSVASPGNHIASSYRSPAATRPVDRPVE